MSVPLTNQEWEAAQAVASGDAIAAVAKEIVESDEYVQLATVKLCWQEGFGWRPGKLDDYPEAI